MKLTTWIYACLALAVLGGVAFLVLSGSMRDSAELLALARSHAEGPGRDPRLALAEVEAALRSAEAEGDSERVAEALELRGRIFGDLGILGRAYADLETVLERYRPGDRRLSLALAEIDLARGDRAAGLERTAALLAADPGLSGAWSVRGRLLAQVAEEELRSCDVQVAASLAGAAASRARELVAEAAGFDPADPRRFRATRELAQLFGGRAEPARELLDKIDAASERIAEARSALASALEGTAGTDGSDAAGPDPDAPDPDAPDPDAIDALLGLFARSGRLDEVALLGFAASVHADVSERGTFLQPLMQALVDTGRPQIAIEIAERCATGDTRFDGSLFKTWIGALYVEKRWNAILPLAGKLCLSSDKAQSQTGWFYMGVAGARLGRWFQAPIALERYIRRDPVEPQPGALTLAYQLLAQCYQYQDRREEERLMLRTALAGRPEGLEHPGIAWYRYSKLVLQLEPSACSELDEALANAVRLLPLSSAEILPIWQREGERCLRSSGLDIAEYCESLVAQGQLVPSGPAGPYELMRIAQVHRARGRTAGVATATKRLLALAPDLLPALDLASEIALELGDEPAAVGLWIQRLELRGQDPEAQARLSAASPASLTSADHMRWMRADPEGIGRQRFARALRAEGRSEQALSGLLAAGSASMPDEDLLLAARILLELDRAGQALRLLQNLPADSGLRARAVPLEIEAASRLGQHGRIETLLAQLETPLEHRAEDLLACAQRLLVAGRTAEARRVLRHMDADPRLRSGEQILRLAQAALAEEDRAAAEIALARAEAFEEDGGPELGYIVLAAERRAWSELPWRVQDLRAASFEPSPLQRALLDLLGERADEAGRHIQRGRAVDPLWSFLESVLPALSPPEEGSGGVDRSSGAIAGDASPFGDGRRDPRPLLARVLALEHPDWTAWATAEMLRQAASGENAPWSTWLAARGLARLGETRRAEELLESLLQASPEFEPAWTQLAELVARRLRGSDDAQLARLQRRRLEALGEPGDDAADLLVAARAAAVAGDLDAAVLAAREALERAPDDPEVILALARIYARRGDWRPAAHALRQLADVEPVSSRSARVAVALELLAQARTAVDDAKFAEIVRSHLAAFAGRFTADPLAALALAEAELAAPGTGAATALAIVFGRLDLFRERAGRPLDELRPGATAAWAAFYERYDPPRALELVRAELDRRPHSIDLWLLLGRALDSAGEREEAIRQYEAVRRMLPDPRASRALARLYSQTGRASEQVQAAVEETVRLAELPGPDAELRLDFARSLAYANSKTREQALGLIEELWSTRGGGAGGELVLEIGELYGTLLCWRGDPADRERARAVLREVETLARDPARRTLLRAMAGLARQIPERAEAEGG